MLGVNRKTIHRWLDSGRITPIIVAGERLIPESEIERLKKERANEGK